MSRSHASPDDPTPVAYFQRTPVTLFFDCLLDKEMDPTAREQVQMRPCEGRQSPGTQSSQRNDRTYMIPEGVSLNLQVFPGAILLFSVTGILGDSTTANVFREQHFSAQLLPMRGFFRDD